jgi:hypothetical protein
MVSHGMMFLYGRITPNMTQTNEIFGNQNSFPGKISAEECGIDTAANIPKESKRCGKPN